MIKKKGEGGWWWAASIKSKPAHENAIIKDKQLFLYNDILDDNMKFEVSADDWL